MLLAAGDCAEELWARGCSVGRGVRSRSNGLRQSPSWCGSFLLKLLYLAEPETPRLASPRAKGMGSEASLVETEVRA